MSTITPDGTITRERTVTPDSTVMRAWAAPVAAVVLGVVTLGFGLAAVLLDSLTHQPGTGGPAADAFITAASVVPAATVGTLLAARRPRNPIGWMLLALVLVNVMPTNQYTVLDYRMHHGALPLGWLAVVLDGFWPLLLLTITLLLWVFPDGKLPAGWWRRPARVAIGVWLLVALAVSSRGMLVVAGHDVRIHTNGDLANPLPGALIVLSIVVIAATLAAWTAWLAIQVPTYRHASGERRQQLKWLYSGAAIFVASLIISVFIAPLIMGEVPGWGSQPVVGALATLATAALPVCIGVAVLKYRLYAIDRIISRVVSYTLITVLLGGVFTGLILLATRVLPIKGPVAVALATLVIAALFNPLRKRVQHAVDRRFNRARYDAEKVVTAFTARLRQTVDLDTVRADLAGAVQEAFQPAHISVWLAGTGRGRPGRGQAGHRRRTRRCGRLGSHASGHLLGWRRGRLLDVPLEYRQHPGLHGPDERDVKPVVAEAFYPPGADDLVAADHQPGAAVRQLGQQEAPQSLGVRRWPRLLWVKPASPQIGQPVQSQEPVWFQRRHFPGVHRAVPGRILHVVADGKVLPLRVDFPGAWVAAVVQAVPGVPAPAVAAHLDEPRPDLIRRCADGHGHRRRPLAAGDQFGARIRPGDFLIGCAPVHEPGAYPRCIDDLGCCHRGRDHDRGLALNRHINNSRSLRTAGQGTNVTSCAGR